MEAIDGLEGTGASGMRDWFFFVNGVESEVGAAEYELSPGRPRPVGLPRLGAAMRVPAIVGAFPEPFLHGVEGKRRPVRVECDDAESEPCRDAKDALERVGVPASGSSLGAPGTETGDAAGGRALAARADRARRLDARGGARGERRVRALRGRTARSLELLDGDGEVARTVAPGRRHGAGGRDAPARRRAGLARHGARPRGRWRRGVRALREDELRDAFAVAVTGSTVEKLPLDER